MYLFSCGAGLKSTYFTCFLLKNRIFNIFQLFESLSSCSVGGKKIKANAQILRHSPSISDLSTAVQSLVSYGLHQAYQQQSAVKSNMLSSCECAPKNGIAAVVLSSRTVNPQMKHEIKTATKVCKCVIKYTI